MAKNIITINNKHYDASTGALLAGDAPHQPHQKLPIHEAPSHKPAHRNPAHHAAAHAPKPSQTLMRRAVKKPVATGRHFKAQGHLDKLALAPLHNVMVKPSAKKIDVGRLQQAKRINKSRSVSHFSLVTSDSGSQRTAVTASPITFDRTAAARAAEAIAQRTFATSKPKTTAELLEYAMQHATAHEQAAHEQPRRHLFKRLSRSTV